MSIAGTGAADGLVATGESVEGVLLAAARTGAWSSSTRSIRHGTRLKPAAAAAASRLRPAITM
jgi:hypothetical protein